MIICDTFHYCRFGKWLKATLHVAFSSDLLDISRQFWWSTFFLVSLTFFTPEVVTFPENPGFWSHPASQLIVVVPVVVRTNFGFLTFFTQQHNTMWKTLFANLLVLLVIVNPFVTTCLGLDDQPLSSFANDDNVCSVEKLQDLISDQCVLRYGINTPTKPQWTKVPYLVKIQQNGDEHFCQGVLLNQNTVATMFKCIDKIG